MTSPEPRQLVVAISSRALFDLSESHRVYEESGLPAYAQYQIEHENDVLTPGGAFPLVQKLLNINKQLNTDRVEVILLSKNSADTGLRVFNSIEHYGLQITRAAFSGGQSPYRYIAPFNCHLFLSADNDDVRRALASGVAAATLLPSDNPTAEIPSEDTELRFAFDGDSVIFSDESERVYKQQGLQTFTQHEKQSARTPLSGGPFKGFLGALHELQRDFDSIATANPIRTALITARGAPAHERVIRTLREWGIRIDESLFLGGRDKSRFLQAFNADVFFDDQKFHCESARSLVATGHVPHGVANEE